jgi:hypothetical protein
MYSLQLLFIDFLRICASSAMQSVDTRLWYVDHGCTGR